MTGKQKDLLRRHRLNVNSDELADAIEAALRAVSTLELLFSDAYDDQQQGLISPGYYSALVALKERLAETPDE